MNRIRRLCRHLACLPRRAGPLAAFAAVAPARSRWPDPPFPPGWKLPPGWNNHLPPPLPLGHVAGPVYQVSPPIPAHTAAGMPVWQVILIAAAAVLLAAGLAALIHRLRATRRPQFPSPTLVSTTGRPAQAQTRKPPERRPAMSITHQLMKNRHHSHGRTP